MLIDKLLKRVEALNLDLQGKTVLTEAASGAYVVTPLLAAIAGAKVFAFAKDSRYGTIEEVFANTTKLIEQYTVGTLDITLVNDLSPAIIAQADVITNSGHLRPLNEARLRYAKDSVAIPLMYEAWEWRDADIELSYVRKRGFKLGATNERHPDIDVFNYLGDMALKQIFDAGICPYGNRFVLICNNDFGPYIAKVVARVCDGLAIIDLDEHRDRYRFDNIEWIGGFPEIRIPEPFRCSEAAIFSAYPFDRIWIGEGTPLSVTQLKEEFDDVLLLRYAGDVDSEVLKREEIRHFPPDVHSGHMGVLPSAVGYDPIIRLQAGGLKAAQALITGEYDYRNVPVVQVI